LSSAGASPSTGASAFGSFGARVFGLSSALSSVGASAFGFFDLPLASAEASAFGSLGARGLRAFDLLLSSLGASIFGSLGTRGFLTLGSTETSGTVVVLFNSVGILNTISFFCQRLDKNINQKVISIFCIRSFKN
jgi:hypothetical protein